MLSSARISDQIVRPAALPAAPIKSHSSMGLASSVDTFVDRDSIVHIIMISGLRLGPPRLARYARSLCASTHASTTHPHGHTARTRTHPLTHANATRATAAWIKQRPLPGQPTETDVDG